MTYYLTKQIIPPVCNDVSLKIAHQKLQRVFGLFGVNVFAWFTELPRTLRAPSGGAPLFNPRAQKTTLSQFYTTRRCVICEELAPSGYSLCEACRENPDGSAAVILLRFSECDRQLSSLKNICATCSAVRERIIECTSFHCPVYFERIRLARKQQNSLAQQAALSEL